MKSKHRSHWFGFNSGAEYCRWRKREMKLHPERHKCLCGNQGVEYDGATGGVRCARCAWCEKQEWAAPWTTHAGRGSHIMPYRVHLNLATL